MNKVELVAAVANKLGESKARASAILDALFDEDGVILETLRQNEEVRISGFGVFGSKVRPEHPARNPKSGAKILVPESVVSTFRFLSAAKKLL